MGKWKKSARRSNLNFSPTGKRTGKKRKQKPIQQSITDLTDTPTKLLNNRNQKDDIITIDLTRDIKKKRKKRKKNNQAQDQQQNNASQQNKQQQNTLKKRKKKKKKKRKRENTGGASQPSKDEIFHMIPGPQKPTSQTNQPRQNRYNNNRNPNNNRNNAKGRYFQPGATRQLKKSKKKQMGFKRGQFSFKWHIPSRGTMCTCCASQSHQTRYCPHRICEACGESGHSDFQCPHRRQNNAPVCLWCQKTGHTEDECPVKKWNCSEECIAGYQCPISSSRGIFDFHPEIRRRMRMENAK